MSIRKLITVATLSVASIVPAIAFAKTDTPTCTLREHQVASVKPYRINEHIGRVAMPKLRGAELFVPAKPGLTAEWLQLSLQRHLTQMRTASMPGCPLKVSDIRVEVTSAGNGFFVRLIAMDTEKAKEVLRRARLLVG